MVTSMFRTTRLDMINGLAVHGTSISDTAKLVSNIHRGQGSSSDGSINTSTSPSTSSLATASGSHRAQGSGTTSSVRLAIQLNFWTVLTTPQGFPPTYSRIIL